MDTTTVECGDVRVRGDKMNEQSERSCCDSAWALFFT